MICSGRISESSFRVKDYNLSHLRRKKNYESFGIEFESMENYFNLMVVEDDSLNSMHLRLIGSFIRSSTVYFKVQRLVRPPMHVMPRESPFVPRSS